MKATQQLHNLGQSLWLDNITRDLLQNGTLKKYIEEFSITGLTSNPTIFNHAIKKSLSYDQAIKEGIQKERKGEELFFDLALADITAAADLFRPIYDRTNGVDGWVSLEVSPLLAYDTQTTIKVAQELHRRAERPNLFIKIPGTKEGLPAIEESIFCGIPINVTLLFSCEQYLAAAEAYLRAIERRIEAGLNPNVHSVASLFISRWDVATSSKLPENLKNQLGLAVGKEAYKAYCDLIQSPRYLKVLNAGASIQRLLVASTGTKDPKASDTLYISGLAAPFTINTMPETTLLAFEDHGKVGAAITADGGNSAEKLVEITKEGVDLKALAETLQKEGAEAFVASWKDLMEVIESKSALLATA